MRGIVTAVHTVEVPRQMWGHKAEQFIPELLW